MTFPSNQIPQASEWISWAVIGLQFLTAAMTAASTAGKARRRNRRRRNGSS
ncbi:hypothetical protein ACFYXH_13455 [Streptomyces sp. NPDC002730]|uniref:hypothetical protein n=1 Tax=Streptomyces sp. NPDC002730 TaxID=3364662 RepID=UPI0036AE0ED1